MHEICELCREREFERLFRTLKIWQRLSLLALNTRSIQRKLATYKVWYNRHRPHGSLGVLTPDEKASSCKAPQVQAIRAVEEVEPVFKIARDNLCDDPRLPILRIRVEFRRRAAGISQQSAGPLLFIIKNSGGGCPISVAGAYFM